MVTHFNTAKRQTLYHIIALLCSKIFNVGKNVQLSRIEVSAIFAVES